MPNAPENAIVKMAHLCTEMAEAEHQLKEEQKRAEEEAQWAVEAHKAEEERQRLEKEKAEKAEEVQAAESGETQSRHPCSVCVSQGLEAANHQCEEDGNTVVGPSKEKRRVPVELEALEVAERAMKRRRAAAPATEKLEEGWKAQIVGLPWVLLEEQRATRQLLADLGEETLNPLVDLVWSDSNEELKVGEEELVEAAGQECLDKIRHFNVHEWKEQEDKEEEEEVEGRVSRVEGAG
ncbi:hypothetical protein SERLA73DRAFT_149059 [Serpula lacrymans var. lacrymans S7.3]|uniref:Uncharacterized protein n=2 Tax=Serpula lacrymans var. lacrymans TaxID=341189 RepID=F8PI55_SERL3|nr:uncharacterized protein SERLADRAFT_432061 [Serpula lacrymans var. lacrymans S7.9]EGO04633.1 hypothetical protein SERLA73DRAFT_149059 [Serpula lacrymans var. lacrymans S7.3]EGO30493.1 hypothetical protein SERLADRAFT_432061 [Serpula lacrymans var. lacrymans S7.9]